MNIFFIYHLASPISTLPSSTNNIPCKSAILPNTTVHRGDVSWNPQRMDTIKGKRFHLQVILQAGLKQMCDVAAGGWKDLWEGGGGGRVCKAVAQRPAQSSSPSYAPVADVGAIKKGQRDGNQDPVSHRHRRRQGFWLEIPHCTSFGVLENPEQSPGLSTNSIGGSMEPCLGSKE